MEDVFLRFRAKFYIMKKATLKLLADNSNHGYSKQSAASEQNCLYLSRGNRTRVHIRFYYFDVFSTIMKVLFAVRILVPRKRL